MDTKTRAPRRLVAVCATSLALIAAPSVAAGEMVERQEDAFGQSESDFSLQPPYADADTTEICNATICLGDVRADPVTGSVAVDVTAAGLAAASSPPCFFYGRPPPNACLPPSPPALGCGSSTIWLRAEGILTGRHELGAPASSVRVSVPVAIAEGSLIGGGVGCGGASGATWAFTVVAECGVLDDEGKVIPGTRQTCQSASTTREWTGPRALIGEEEAVLTAELVPPGGKVVAPGPIEVRVRLLGFVSMSALRVSWNSVGPNPTGGGAAIRLDLSGSVPRMDGLVTPA